MPVVDLDMPIRDYVAAFKSRPKTPADEAEGRGTEADGKMCWDAEEWLKTKPDRWTYRDALVAIPNEQKPIKWIWTSKHFTGADLTSRTDRFCNQLIIDNTSLTRAGAAFLLYKEDKLPADQKTAILDILAPDDSKKPRHTQTDNLKRDRAARRSRA